MRKLAVLSTAALISAGAIASSGAEARDRRGAIAAGVIGGIAAGALIGAARTPMRHRLMVIATGLMEKATATPLTDETTATITPTTRGHTTAQW